MGYFFGWGGKYVGGRAVCELLACWSDLLRKVVSDGHGS